MVTMPDVGRLHIVHFDTDMPAEILELSYTATAFGGRRAWFQCSKLGCGKRVAVLHATPTGFRCRHCTHLGYASKFNQPRDRAMQGVRKIRERLGGGHNLLEPFPEKPKGMHWRTYDVLFAGEVAFWKDFEPLLCVAQGGAY